MSAIRRIILSALLAIGLLIPQACFAAGIFVPAGGFNIPADAQIIDDYAFYGCAALEGEWALPTGVTEIGDYAFSGCAGLTGELILPPEITRIGAHAFENCIGLTGSPYIPETVAVGEGAFGGSSVRPVLAADFTYTTTDGEATVTGFLGTGVSALRIPDTLGGYPVTAIADGAFESRTDIAGPLALPRSVTRIGSNAFRGCTGLTGSLTLPPALASLGQNAFAGCTGLTGSVLLPEALIGCPDSAFADTALTVVSHDSYASGFTYEIVDGEATITGFSGAVNLGLHIPSSLGGCPVTAIAPSAFLARTDVTGSVHLPDTLVSIGNRAFYGCSGLTGALTLPASLQAIGSRAFYGCSGLTGSVLVPEAVLSMGQNVFGNTNLLILYESIVGLAISAPSDRLAVGYSMQLSVSVVPEDGNSAVTWSTSDETVASVTDGGLVTGLAEGAATITAVSAAKPALSASVTLTVSSKPQYRALLIGNIYPGTRNYLPGCETDIQAMASMLRTMNATMYDLTIARNLSASGMLSAIGGAFAEATPYDVSLVYYTGHGDSTGGRLVGTDGSYLTFAQMRRALDAIPGKKIVILDSCYSGHAIGKSLFAEVSYDTLESVNDAVIAAFSSSASSAYSTRSAELAADAYYVLTAARGAEQSAATSESGVDYSAFTRCLLRGSGYDQITNELHSLLADTDGDGGVTLDEGYVYVRDHLDEIIIYDQNVQVYPEGSDMLLWGQAIE